MVNLPDLLAPLVGERPSLIFSLLLIVHVFTGLACVVTGAVAALSAKQAGRHPRFGGIYYRALAVVFATATGMAVLRWSQDAYLFALGATSFGVASIGYTARKIRWQGWTSAHIIGMSLSYVVLLTAFYVDNGPRLPLWNRLPTVAFWTLPSIVGLPLVARALVRHTRLVRDLRATARALARGWAARRPD